MQTGQFRHSNEDSLLALDLIDAAWDQAKENGVPHELMAYAAVFTGMRDLVAMFGERTVAAMVKSLETRIKQGEFSNAANPLH